mmetsp:Transcript_91376/g.284775  ORF Transcript_91376/g.284775 Transcript_91376/m.284775 type:complete len:83 (-) Transcript_91376:96-344(-)
MVGEAAGDEETGAPAPGVAASSSSFSGTRRQSFKATNQVEAQKGIHHSIIWHLKKFDACTWWIFIVTGMFALLVYLTPLMNR